MDYNQARQAQMAIANGYGYIEPLPKPVAMTKQQSDQARGRPMGSNARSAGCPGTRKAVADSPP